jgi:hypothetical protein
MSWHTHPGDTRPTNRPHTRTGRPALTHRHTCDTDRPPDGRPPGHPPQPPPPKPPTKPRIDPTTRAHLRGLAWLTTILLAAVAAAHAPDCWGW